MTENIMLLNEICVPKTSSFTLSKLDLNNGEYPLFGASGFLGSINSFQTTIESVAIVKDGSIGKVFKLPINSSVLGTLLILEPNDNVTRNYLYYYLKYLDLGRNSTGATIPHIYFKDFGKTKMIIPKIMIQNKITKFFDEIENKLSSLLKKIDFLDELIKSQFNEMFGEVLKPKRKIIALKNANIRIFAGGDLPADFNRVSNEDYQYPIYANGEANNGLYGYSREYKVDTVALTISARGTIGYSSIRKPNFTPIVRLITIPENNVFSLPYLQKHFEYFRVNGSGASIAQLTVPMVEDYKIIVPPLIEQELFSNFVKQVDKLKYNRDFIC